jgi:tubulin polyglutamylase TTLL1
MNFTGRKYSFEQDILPRMKDMASDAIKANFHRLDIKRKLNNFEIFGLDFMIDNHFKPWLIEINFNPCLEISSALLSRIIPGMIESSLRIGLDPLFPPPSHYPPTRRYQLSDNILNNIKFELIFD